MQAASVRLYQGLSAPSPANALPLLLEPEANAYITSERPCGPDASIVDLGPSSTSDRPVKVRTSSGITRM